MYTCSCKPGQHWVLSADGKSYTCVDLCSDANINKNCTDLNAVCNPLAALSLPTNATLTNEMDKLDWRSICLCQVGLVREKAPSAHCTLPQFTSLSTFSSYTVQLNFSKESYQLLYQFKAETEKALHQVPLSNGAFLSRAEEQLPAENFKQLVKDYQKSVKANEDVVKNQVDGPMALLVGRRLLDVALNRLVVQYMGQLVEHSEVTITTRRCENAAEEGFVACSVEIVVANETQAAKHIDGGNLVRFFQKQFSDNCVDDDDGDVCTIAIAGVKEEKKDGQFFWNLEDNFEEDEAFEGSESVANVTEPISLILSKKSVENATFEQFDVRSLFFPFDLVIFTFSSFSVLQKLKVS